MHLHGLPAAARLGAIHDDTNVIIISKYRNVYKTSNARKES
jgi:hypothetical protein